MVKPYLYIASGEDYWQPDGTDNNRGMSGWLTGADGAFRIPYRSDFKFGVDDYTVVQTFNALASGGTRVATYDDYTTNAGLRLSQTSDVFTVESGDVSVNLPSNPLDGTNRYFMVERESGVAVNAYLDDFDTAVATVADNGTDIDNTEPLDLAYDGTTYMDGMLGVTIVFNRLLEEYEKDDVFYWIESGYDVESEPDWLRTAATLYINPEDEVQQAEYEATESMVNLGLNVPDEVYVRYAFTSDDGISNPVLSHNDVRFANPRLYRQFDETAHDSGAVVTLPYGHGKSPAVVRSFGTTPHSQTVLPLEELGATWVNDDWTISFWAKLDEDGLANNIVDQGSTGGIAVRDGSDDTVSLYVDGTPVLVSTVAPAPYNKYSMVTVTKSGSNFELFFDAVSNDTGTFTPNVTLTNDLLYGGVENSLLGPLHIWTRALSQPEVESLYNAAPEVDVSLFSDTINITDGFSTQNLNWQAT